MYSRRELLCFFYFPVIKAGRNASFAHGAAAPFFAPSQSDPIGLEDSSVGKHDHAISSQIAHAACDPIALRGGTAAECRGRIANTGI